MWFFVAPFFLVVQSDRPPELSRDQLIQVYREKAKAIDRFSVTMRARIGRRPILRDGSYGPMEYRTELDDVIEEASGRTRLVQVSQQTENTPEGPAISDVQNIYVYDGQVTRVIKFLLDTPHVGEFHPNRAVALPFWGTLFHVNLKFNTLFISEYLAKYAGEETKHSRVRDGGRELLFVQITHVERLAPEFRVVDRLWFDPAQGYAVTKAEVWDEPESGGKALPRVQFDMSDHVKVADELWFPSRVRYRDSTTGLDAEPGVNVTEIDATLENWNINPSVGENTFKLSFTKGLLVKDMGRGATYRAKEIDDSLITKQVEEAKAIQERYAALPVPAMERRLWVLPVIFVAMASIVGLISAVVIRRIFISRKNYV